jgi:hypothetical protein
MRYYVYTYFIDGTPEYVGKGTNNKDNPRCLAHFSISKNRWGNHLRSSLAKEKLIDVRIAFVSDLEPEAFQEECRLISSFGRRDLGTGSLYNLTAGGEGASGHIKSPETRAKLSEAQKRKKGTSNRTPEQKAKMSEGQRNMLLETKAKMIAKISEAQSKWTPETRAKISAKISEAAKGRTHSLETKAKMSASRKGIPISAEALAKRKGILRSLETKQR